MRTSNGKILTATHDLSFQKIRVLLSDKADILRISHQTETLYKEGKKNDQKSEKIMK